MVNNSFVHSSNLACNEQGHLTDGLNVSVSAYYQRTAIYEQSIRENKDKEAI